MKAHSARSCDYNLEAEGFRVLSAQNSDEGLILVDDMSPDTIVLTWMWPSVSGLGLSRRLKFRSDTRNVPIIKLSARSEEADRVRGLETAAGEYVTKL